MTISDRLKEGQLTISDSIKEIPVQLNKSNTGIIKEGGMTVADNIKEGQLTISDSIKGGTVDCI